MPQMTKETTLNEFNDSNALNEIHEVEDKMKISTAEIKIYIIECVKTYGMYTNDDSRIPRKQPSKRWKARDGRREMGDCTKIYGKSGACRSIRFLTDAIE